MSGEPQLERSVLEGKERDKLQAIADALGLKIPARARKTELIDGILRATGVETAPPADADAAKPKRTPRRRAAEAAPAANGTDGAGAPATASPAGNGQAPAAEPAPEAAEPQPEAPAHAAAAPDGPVTEAPGARPEAADPAPVAAAGGDTRQQAPRPTPQPVGPPGPGNALHPPAPPSPSPAAPQHHSGQPGQPAQSGQPGQPAEGGGELRRNRRRRGRDRDRAGYDQQAQQADQVFTGDPLPCDGLLELRPEGFGFLRTRGYLPSPDDVYVSTSQVRKFGLRAGDRIVGGFRPATTQERFGALLRIDAVGDLTPDEARRRPRFDDLAPSHPAERLALELGDPAHPAYATVRVLDLLAPIGRGQRGLVVSAPRAGQTTVLQHIAMALEANHPDVELVVVLVDARPEEVADLRASLKGEVVGSTFDRPPEEHANAAELAVEVAKRRVELGGNVVVLLDGLTRLARALNLAASPNGRITAGEVDAGALHAVKRLLAAARNAGDGASLTVLATVLDGTGSTADAAVYEEVAGTANMVLRLDASLARRRMYPAIDVGASSTAHEELLVGEEHLRQVTELRRALADLSAGGSGYAAHDMLLARLRATATNADLLADPVAGLG